MTLEKALQTLRARRGSLAADEIYAIYCSKMRQLETWTNIDTSGAGEKYAAEMALLGIQVVAGVGLVVAGIVFPGPTAVGSLPLAAVGGTTWEVRLNLL